MSEEVQGRGKRGERSGRDGNATDPVTKTLRRLRSWRFPLGCLVVLIAVSAARAQESAAAKVPVPDWQQAAGGKMSFDVASVRLDKGEFRLPSFALSADDWFREPNGRFHADFSVATYIEFAYKLWLTIDERKAMLAGYPAWIASERYAIEATAPLHATKDQYRLMMQALLAERFGLKVHFENREEPVLAMVLIKPGKPGPSLIPHEKGLPCDAAPLPETWPSQCYSFGARPKGELFFGGSRGTSMELIAKFLGSVAGSEGEIGRPVVDQTGLTGQWDFTLEVAKPGRAAMPDGGSVGPTVLEGMQEQLGIKLKPTKAVVPVLVIDHVELPSEN
jgi:uncharacterized protein (TIGR03435 family)